MRNSHSCAELQFVVNLKSIRKRNPQSAIYIHIQNHQHEKCITLCAICHSDLSCSQKVKYLLFSNGKFHALWDCKYIHYTDWVDCLEPFRENSIAICLLMRRRADVAYGLRMITAARSRCVNVNHKFINILAMPQAHTHYILYTRH